MISPPLLFLTLLVCLFPLVVSLPVSSSSSPSDLAASVLLEDHGELDKPSNKQAATAAAATTAKPIVRKPSKRTAPSSKSSPILSPSTPPAAGRKAASSKSKSKSKAPKLSAAERLTPAKHREKFEEFLQQNPTARGKVSFEIFMKNRERIVALNDRFGRKIFRSSTPFSGLTPSTFRKQVLTVANPYRNAKKYHDPHNNVPIYNLSFTFPAPKSSPLNKKRSQVKASLIEEEMLVDVETAQSQSPRTEPYNKKAGAAGADAAIAGSRGGDAGAGAGIAGSKGGDAGGSGGIAGSKGGDAGAGAGIAGSKGGDGKTSIGPVVPLGVGPGDVAKKTGIYQENGGTPQDAQSMDSIKAYLTRLGVQQKMLDGAIQTLKYGYQLPEWLYSSTIKSNLPQIDGKCGSCWAHSTIAALTAYRVLNSSAINRLSTPPLNRRYSPQQILNCVRTDTTNGCSGGSPMDALMYLRWNRIGLIGEFPLTPVPGRCKPTMDLKYPSGIIASSGWGNAGTPCPPSGDCPKQAFSELEMLYRLQGGAVQQVIVYVDATNWATYKSDGGLFPISLCSSSVAAGNHVVLVNGYGVDATTGVPYWQLLNSWGNDWGDKGHIRLPFGLNACGLANFAINVNPGPNFKQGRPISNLEP